MKTVVLVYGTLLHCSKLDNNAIRYKFSLGHVYTYSNSYATCIAVYKFSLGRVYTYSNSYATCIAVSHPDYDSTGRLSNDWNAAMTFIAHGMTPTWNASTVHCSQTHESSS